MIYKICAVVITGCILGVTVFGTSYLLAPLDDSYLADCYELDSIVVIPIYGDIAWGVSEYEGSVYGYEVAAVLEEIMYDENWDYAGIIFDIDSPGGYPVASFRLSEMIRNLQVPTVAAIGDTGASGGYAIAAATDRIFVHPLSDVGSIGVTASYVNESKANEELGYLYEALSTGEFKDTGDPAKSLSDEERDFMMDNLENAHEYFVQQIAQDRGIAYDRVKVLADGKWYPGAQAIKLGLADSIGGLDEAIAYIQGETGKDNPVCYVPVL